MLSVEDVSLSIGETNIIDHINVNCEKGEILTIVGPNGCGKSTLLKVISRIYKPSSGKVSLLGKEIHSYDTKELAKIMAGLPQKKTAAGDMTVEQLVQYGRYPHTKFGNRLTQLDYQKVEEALEDTGIKHLKKRLMSTLSGGESQMAWIAMCVAQDPKIILLDEPTTYLDISYQLEVLELVRKLNREHGLTIVMVLHDINQAIRYSDKIYMMKKSHGYKFGTAEEIFSEEAFAEVFRVKMDSLYSEHDQHTRYYQPERSLKSNG